jgi:hypothetical protein
MYLSASTLLHGNDPRFKDISRLRLVQDPRIYVEWKWFDEEKRRLLVGHECVERDCTEFVFVGGPFCVYHTYEHYKAAHKQTSLTFEGKQLLFQGLFACHDFLPGQKIVPY